MKKYTAIIMNILFFTMSSLVSMEQSIPNVGVYVINKAEDINGKSHTIFAQVEANTWHPEKGRLIFGEQKVPFNDSVYISQLDQIGDVETSGDNTYGWTKNKDILKKIKDEAIEKNMQNKNVYLQVVAGKKNPYYIDSWYWSEATKMEFLSLENIKRGFLGQDYAKKVTEICNADYTKALAAGYVNLCEYLEKRLKKSFLNGAQTKIKEREEAIKRIIDNLYAQLKLHETPKIHRKKSTSRK